MGLAMVGSTAISQVIFSVESPSPIQGFYEFTSNGDGTNWGLANLVGVQVIDTVMIVNDGSTGTNAQGHPISAEGCNTLVNNLTGKVALVYRNTCDFGLKALKAQQAGARAVIIVNREEGMVNMTGGAVNGPQVTIPVVFVSASTGTLITNAMQSGDVVVFIGDKTGYYDNDLTIFDNESLRADFGSLPIQLAASGSELSIPLSTTAHNFGVNAQTGITMNTVITRNGTEVYNVTSPAEDLDPMESVTFTSAAFTLPTFQTGNYELTYTIQYGATDDFPADNVVTSKFAISDSLWSLTRLDAGEIVGVDAFYRPATLPSNTFRPCIVLENPNASRLAIDGIYFGGVTVGGDDTATIGDISGQELEVNVYKWDDANTITTTATFDDLDEVRTTSYSFLSDIEDSTVFMPITPFLRLEDDQKYLICVTTYEPRLFLAYSTNDFYDQNIVADGQTRFPAFSDDAAINFGEAFGIAPSIAVRVNTELSTNEVTLVEASAFPNPAKDLITVKVKASGTAVLKVTDMAGRQVISETVKIEGGKFTTNVADTKAGSYIFNLNYENGTTSQFKVVIAK